MRISSSRRSSCSSEYTSVGLPATPMFFPGCRFSLAISSARGPLTSVEFLHSTFFRVVDTILERVVDVAGVRFVSRSRPVGRPLLIGHPPQQDPVLPGDVRRHGRI